MQAPDKGLGKKKQGFHLAFYCGKGEIEDLFAAAGVLASSNLQTQTSCVWLLFLRSFLCQQAVNEGAQNKTGAH